MGTILRRLVIRLWGMALLLASGYLWNLRGRPMSRAWKVGTLTCIILLVVGVVLLLRYA